MYTYILLTYKTVIYTKDGTRRSIRTSYTQSQNTLCKFTVLYCRSVNKHCSKVTRRLFSWLKCTLQICTLQIWVTDTLVGVLSPLDNRHLVSGLIIWSCHVYNILQCYKVDVNIIGGSRMNFELGQLTISPFNIIVKLSAGLKKCCLTHQFYWRRL